MIFLFCRGQSDFTVPELPKLPKSFGIGLIVGPSGSGKTSILRRHFDYKPAPPWHKSRRVREYFEGAEQLRRLQVSSAGLLTSGFSMARAG